MAGDLSQEIVAANEVFRLRRYEEAYQIFSRLIGRIKEEGLALDDKELAGLYASRGTSLLESDEREVYRNPELFHEVMDDLDYAIELDPANMDYSLVKGRLWLNCGFEDYSSEALASFQTILKEQPENLELILYIGQIHYKQQDYDLAIKFFTRVIEQIEEADLFELRALSNFRKFPSDVRASIRDFNKALSLAPDRTEYRLWLAECYFELGELDQAVDQYDQLIELVPDNAGYYVDRGTILIANEPEAALEDFTTAIEMDEHPMGYNNRAYYYKLKGMFEEAVSDAMNALKKDPKKTIAYATLAEIYADWGKQEEFYKYLEQALKFFYKDVVDVIGNESFRPYKQEEKFRSLIARFSNSDS